MPVFLTYECSLFPPAAWHRGTKRHGQRLTGRRHCCAGECGPAAGRAAAAAARCRRAGRRAAGWGPARRGIRRLAGAIASSACHPAAGVECAAAHLTGTADHLTSAGPAAAAAAAAAGRSSAGSSDGGSPGGLGPANADTGAAAVFADPGGPAQSPAAARQRGGCTTAAPGGRSRI